MSLIHIEQAVKNINALVDENSSPRELALAIEANQLFKEYLEALEDSNLRIDPGITVKVKGTVIRFDNQNAFANWLSEYLT